MSWEEKRFAHTETQVIVLAFLTRVNGQGGAPEVDFASADDECTTIEGTNLLKCPQIGYVFVFVMELNDRSRATRLTDFLQRGYHQMPTKGQNHHLVHRGCYL